jgi:hypothetical protein
MLIHFGWWAEFAVFRDRQEFRSLLLHCYPQLSQHECVLHPSSHNLHKPRITAKIHLLHQISEKSTWQTSKVQPYAYDHLTPATPFDYAVDVFTTVHVLSRLVVAPIHRVLHLQ